MIDADDDQRSALLKENSAFVDVRLAHLLKDICLEGWSSEPVRALAAAECLKELAGLNSNQEISALHHWSHGLELLIKGEMERAIEALDLSQNTFRQLGQTKLAASTQVSKLIGLAMLGRYDEAIDVGMRAREVFQSISDPLALGKVEHNIGNIYFRRDRYKEAEEFQRSARKHFERVDDQVQLAKIENSLALTLSQQHLTKAAEQLYEQALKRAEATGLKSTQAEIESSIGTLAQYQGYYDRALDYLERSRRKYEELSLPHVLAMTEQEIADTYLDLNLAPEAIEIYQRVEERFARLGMHADEARALAYHGWAEIKLGNLSCAQQLLSKSRELYVTEGNDVGAAFVELTEAQLLCAQGNYFSAAIAASHAEQVLTTAGNPRRVVFARWLQGEAVRLDLRNDEAKALLDAALDLSHRWEQPDISSRCLTSLGLLAASDGNTGEAEQKFRLAIEVIERMRAPLPGEEFRSAFFADKLTPYAELARLNLASSPPRLAEAFSHIEDARSRSLVDAMGGSLRVRLYAQDEFEKARLLELDEKRHELSYFYNQLNLPSKPADQVVQLHAEVRQREHAITEITRQVRHRRVEHGVAGGNLDFASFQKSLGSGKVLIEFVNLGDELLAFVISDTQIDVVRNLETVSVIADEVNRFRFQIDSLRFGSAAIRKHLAALTDRIQRHLQFLYRKLIAPLKHLCGDRDLVICPTGWLHYLPFHALHDGEKYLIESVAVTYAPGATVLQQCLMREHREIRTALIMGVADERTPQVLNEVEQIKRVFSRPDVFVNAQATLANLKQRCANTDLLHLACHAQFRADNPQFSAVQLGDGWLTVADTYELELRSTLVTLSACETGMNSISPGEELIGLARGFLSAGSASVLLSLWTVDDEATRQLMTSFYRELARQISPAKALQIAQVQVLNQKTHPFFWSPFILVGRC